MLSICCFFFIPSTPPLTNPPTILFKIILFVLYIFHYTYTTHTHVYKFYCVRCRQTKNYKPNNRGCFSWWQNNHLFGLYVLYYKFCIILCGLSNLYLIHNNLFYVCWDVSRKAVIALVKPHTYYVFILIIER